MISTRCNSKGSSTGMRILVKGTPQTEAFELRRVNREYARLRPYSGPRGEIEIERSVSPRTGSGFVGCPAARPSQRSCSTRLLRPWNVRIPRRRRAQQADSLSNPKTRRCSVMSRDSEKLPVICERQPKMGQGEPLEFVEYEVLMRLSVDLFYQAGKVGTVDRWLQLPV